jgi:peptidoglycan/LPS O-acetylase OafA/YrhL
MIGTNPPAARPQPRAFDRPQKLMGLEIVRFLAAVAVLFWHYQNMWWTPEGLTGFVRSEQPLYRYFSGFYEFGRYGVQVFWSISGYIFFWKYRQSVADRRIGGKTFFVLRFSRLYPLHFATLLLVALLQLIYMHMKGNPFVYGHDDLFHFGLQLMFASNWGFEAGSSFNGPIWSISLEILVYIAFFFMLRYLGASLLPSILIVLAAGLAYLLGNHNPIFECFVCFYVGGLTAVLAGTAAAHRHRGLLLALAIALLVLVPAFGALLGATKVKAIAQVIAIGYVPILLYVMAEHCQIPRMFTNSVQVAGNMTYSSYLIHFPLQLSIAIVCAALGVSIPKASTAFFLGYLASVLLLAWLIFILFEMPCQSFVRRKLSPANKAS